MKKTIIALAFALPVTLSLSACGKSEASKIAEKFNQDDGTNGGNVKTSPKEREICQKDSKCQAAFDAYLNRIYIARQKAYDQVKLN